jgi:hypothetical protein
MAYISKEQITNIRNELKRLFPESKFAVRKGAGSHSVNVSILRGQYDFSEILTPNGHCPVNHHFLGNYPHNEFLVAVLSVIQGQGWYDNSEAQFDHFDIAYYINVEIGRWDKPYQKI